ncbi:hypothetical protein G7072_03405 [Nocardioides sp. HDW12B]|nr:hypothetical protein [Nocardioides sp. HDW12B]QIK65515.1 hypothetical protein G7072_03405 [Nocardioides sp. HDW12B]
MGVAQPSTRRWPNEPGPWRPEASATGALAILDRAYEQFVDALVVPPA